MVDGTARARRRGPGHIHSHRTDADALPRRSDPAVVQRGQLLATWLGIAAALAVLGGRRGRRAALEGVVAIGVTSATVNLLAKSLAARPRPHREELESFPSRAVAMPASSSFPSGHAASAFAFSYAIGRHMPELAVPVRLLAGAVAYSRVHVGVHYPGDVTVGAMMGWGLPRCFPRSAIASRLGDVARTSECFNNAGCSRLYSIRDRKVRPDGVLRGLRASLLSSEFE